jgi:hypothetical protein
MNKPKLTTKDAHDAIKAFARQSESNIAFGILADTEKGDFSTFIKGEELEILALINMQMAKDNNFKKLLYEAVEIHKTAPIQKIINKYENKHSRDN